MRISPVNAAAGPAGASRPAPAKTPSVGEEEVQARARIETRIRAPVGIRPGFRGGLSRQGRDAHAKVSEQGGASPEVTARLGRRAVRIDAGAARARALAMS
jgi:hypothetical protein